MNACSPLSAETGIFSRFGPTEFQVIVRSLSRLAQVFLAFNQRDIASKVVTSEAIPSSALGVVHQSPQSCTYFQSLSAPSTSVSLACGRDAVGSFVDTEYFWYILPIGASYTQYPVSLRCDP